MLYHGTLRFLAGRLLLGALVVALTGFGFVSQSEPPTTAVASTGAVPGVITQSAPVDLVAVQVPMGQHRVRSCKTYTTAKKRQQCFKQRAQHRRSNVHHQRPQRHHVRAVASHRNAPRKPPVSQGNSVWDRVAQCESGGNWNTNTGNGFSGGLQFTPSTWRAFGGTGEAYNASREQQIAVAERVLAGQGWGAWPVCSRKAHATGYAASAE